MVIYPDDDLGMQEWETERYVDNFDQAREIIRNPLNDEVRYRIGDVLYLEVTLRPAAPWADPITRRYNVHSDVGEWVISHYDTESPVPNTRCPVCGAYSTIQEYTGIRTLLNITCSRCAEQGYPEWTTYDNFDINNLPMPRLWFEPVEKVNWAVEGF